MGMPTQREAGASADRKACVRLGQRGRVVDAVAHHADTFLPLARKALISCFACAARAPEHRGPVAVFTNIFPERLPCLIR